VLQDLKRPEEALESYGRAADLRPNFAQAHFNRALLYQQLKDPKRALECYDRVIAIAPDWADAHNNRGNALVELTRYEEAMRSYEAAVERRPTYAEAYNNCGNVLAVLQRPREALVKYGRAIQYKPDYAEAHLNCGNTLRALRDFAGAVRSYGKALALRPDDAGAHLGQSMALRELNRFDEAVASAERAVRLDPELPYALGQLLLVKMHACDWDRINETRGAVIAAIDRGMHAAVPFTLIATDCPAHILRRCAELYTAEIAPPPARAADRAPPRDRSRNERIKLAYVSGDFHAHATAYLMTGVFEAHDRDRFELYAVSLGRNDHSEIRMRLERPFEGFIEAGDRTDREIADLLRDLEVDIAVDLKGLTKGARPGIFALRPAPVQVNYLGYPGTMGVGYIDYLLADQVIIPDSDQRWYAENIVYLPDTYQCNDAQRVMTEKTPSRRDVGLPERGFVFCSFNGSYKITPLMFDVWMRLLQKTEGSVLWLRESNDASMRNLRREAESRGVAGERLVFAPSWSLADHLARHRLADLFLDTLPCGAHTGASDALWAGLPVLTCLGDSFAGRVAASLLDAIGLPEMVMRSLGEYEARALEFAHDPAALVEIRERLARNRNTHALFDTARFTRNLETAYEHMVERHRSGEPPRPFAVGRVEGLAP
jgi:predicted O-linked N-acetylglucosamine transferase (SPINDLY family)